MTAIPPEWVTAVGNALRERWLRQYPGIVALDLDPMDWAVTALEAAEPHITAAERERMRPALRDALDGLELMLPYVPDYFRKKWDHQGYVDRARKALDDLRGDTP